MRRVALRGCGVAAVLALALAGCAAPAPKPLYQWEGYQAQLYQHLRTPQADAHAQVATMEQDLQKIRAGAGAVPPGFHAHLGYLYLSLGSDDKALASLEAERDAFPEFAPYMRFLLARAAAQKKS